ncbi:MAG: dimethylarginine dimethylaminohydrolase family protein [Acidimicrobiales bacterium]
MTGLAWGRRFLMCRPDHFGVLYEINPWMHAEVRPDPDRAVTQFEGLVAALQAAGAGIELQDPADGLPDLVFTANAGIVNGHQFVPAHFRHPERQGETAHDVAWFSARGWRVDRLPADLIHEGAGDALPFSPDGGDGPVLVSGYRLRSDAASHAHLSRLTGAPVRSVELVDERLYHLDLTFCPLDGRRAMVAPLGLDSYGRKVVKALVPEPLALEDDEALAFCANSVVVGSNIVMPACPPRVGRQLEAWGFSVAVAPVDEFQKAGGGCRCLTLALDVVLSEAGAGPR